MISAQDVEGLRPEEKDVILDAMLGMAWSDGKIHPDEVALLKSVIHHFSSRGVDELLKEYKPDTERVGRKIASSDLGPAGKKLMLRVMAYIAAAEGEIDEKELAFYRGCLRAFGVPEPVRQRMEEKVRRDVYVALARRKLAGTDLTDGARAELDALRKRLEIPEGESAELEAQARKA